MSLSKPVNYMLAAFLLLSCTFLEANAETNYNFKLQSIEQTMLDRNDYQSPDIGNIKADPGINDPLEFLNRSIYALSEFADYLILKPLALTYKTLVPDWGRERVGSFLRNLNSPVIFFNNILQGNVGAAGNTLSRFVINSTIGIGGLFDRAASHGFAYRAEDFGQTLGVWGLGTGPYLYLPIIGPSSIRDGVGRVADIFMDPLTYLLDEDLQIARYSATAIHTRSENLGLTDDIDRISLDSYATKRSLYFQSRENEVSNGSKQINYNYDEIE